MFESSPGPALDLPFEETIRRLIDSSTVKGIALFGSSASHQPQPTSDYDLLLLIDNLDIHIFQLHTWIGGISADVVFVQLSLAERVLALNQPVAATSPEGFVISWMQNARILHDETSLLAHLQTKIRQREWRTFEVAATLAYDDWFWLNFDLRHIQRLVRSSDPVHLMTADLRLMACVAQVCRVYFRLRGLAWSGEKNALRYLQAYDAPTFQLLSDTLNTSERGKRVALCERLVSKALEPVGGLWRPFESSVYLQAPASQPDDVASNLAFWNGLFSQQPPAAG